MDKILKKYLKSHDIDGVSVGVIDFNKEEFDSISYQKTEQSIIENSEIYFDLASLTKVLTNGFFYLAFKNQMQRKHRLLIEHRAGLPSWGLLSKNKWKEEILSYSILESPTLYSDYSALRFMLEVENDFDISFKSEVEKFYDKEIKFYKDLDIFTETLQNGFYKKERNFRKVHDPNSLNLDCFTSHAGLFATIGGVCKTLLKADSNLNLLQEVASHIDKENRFVLGWDRAENLESTSAGKGCSVETFGHLGFTGTSIWIDPVKEKAFVLLTNSTKNYWYDKKDLNQLRKDIGEIVWQSK